MGRTLADGDRRVSSRAAWAKVLRSQLDRAPQQRATDRAPAETAPARLPITNLPEAESPQKAVRVGTPHRARWRSVTVRLHPTLYALLHTYMSLSGRSISKIVREGLARVLQIPQGLS